MTHQPQVFSDQVPFVDGHLLPPERPGLGVELVEEAVQGLDPAPAGPGVGFRRDDGSYTNW